MNILRFDSESDWTAAVTDLWQERLRANPGLRICLPSGHTPLPLFAELGRRVQAGRVSLRAAEIFALDDYGGLPADDPGRCVNMLRRHLLEKVDLPRDRFHSLDTSRPDLDRVCAEYAAAIGPAGFDLTLLGIGLNGHLGLNEPGSAPDSTVRRVEMHAASVASSAKYLTHGSLPTWGLTVGLKELLASREVWLLATGGGKADILDRVCHGPVTAEVPASLLREHPNCLLLVDATAGARIQPTA